MKKIVSILLAFVLGFILVACNRGYYTVTFDVDGGSPVASIKVDHNNEIGELPITTKDGSTFDGWFTDIDKTMEANASLVVSSDMTLYAKWIKDVDLEGVTVSYEGLADTKDFDKTEFFLQRNTDFNINVYLINDLDLEIKSIKINDEVYLKETFNEGSTNKLVSISLNTKNDTGINNFSITEIIFVKDDKDIKASINVNETIVIKVQARFIPVITVTAEEADVFSYNLELLLTDREDLIATSDGNAVFKLFDDKDLIAEEALVKLSNSLSLTNLKPNSLYTYQVYAAFDQLDGDGVQTHLIFEGNLQTNQAFDVELGRPEETSIKFNYTQNVDEVVLNKIDLELNGSVVKNVDLTATEITGLTKGTEYQLVFHYSFELNGRPFNAKQIVDAVTFELIMTNVIRNTTTVPFSRGGTIIGNVQIPIYREAEEELRAIWFSTVANIDIPKMVPGESGMQIYKDTITLALDKIKEANMNAVFFQIRPMNDAWYESDLAPWSRYITGIEGRNPGFDVLEFVITEAHARGIELHGWLNPYRVANSATALQGMHESNFAYGREDLWLQGTTSAGALQTILDPGIPEVQEYIVDVIDEIITKYPSINGIHFDDYFYLDQAMIGENSSSPDYNTWQTYGSEKLFDQFRRDSVTTIIREIYNNVQAFNALNGTSIKFGISPSGVWANIGSNPLGSDTTGWQHLYALHADTKAWIDEGIIHYIVPQIYWDFNLSAARYANLVDWWARTVRGTDVDLIIGMGPYRYRDTAWPVRALEEQLRFNQLYPEVVGSSFFTYQDLVALSPERLVNAMNIVKNELWKNEVLVPWETNIYN